MRLAIVGQQAFGKSVLEAFIARGTTVAGVFCAQEKPGAKPDPLRISAEERGVPVFQLESLRGEAAAQTLRSLNVDLGVMAYVVQFAPVSFLSVPKHGTIQYHPSLLPRYRGPSSINWPIIKGDRETGLTIFRPTEGLDEGPIILQRTVPIGPDDTTAMSARSAPSPSTLPFREAGSSCVRSGSRPAPRSPPGRWSPPSISKAESPWSRRAADPRCPPPGHSDSEPLEPDRRRSHWDSAEAGERQLCIAAPPPDRRNCTAV